MGQGVEVAVPPHISQDRVRSKYYQTLIVLSGQGIKWSMGGNIQKSKKTKIGRNRGSSWTWVVSFMSSGQGWGYGFKTRLLHGGGANEMWLAAADLLETISKQRQWVLLCP